MQIEMEMEIPSEMGMTQPVMEMEGLCGRLGRCSWQEMVVHSWEQPRLGGR